MSVLIDKLKYILINFGYHPWLTKVRQKVGMFHKRKGIYILLINIWRLVVLWKHFYCHLFTIHYGSVSGAKATLTWGKVYDLLVTFWHQCARFLFSIVSLSVGPWTISSAIKKKFRKIYIQTWWRLHINVTNLWGVKDHERQIKKRLEPIQY